MNWIKRLLGYGQTTGRRASPATSEANAASPVSIGRTPNLAKASSPPPLAAAQPTTERSHVDEFDMLVRKLGEDSDARADAAEALGQLGDTRAFQALVSCLRDPSAEVRARACIALRKLDDTRAVDPLIEALKDDHEYVRKHAAEALGSLGDTRAVVPLEKAAANRDRFLVSVSANMALQEIRDRDKNPRPSSAAVSEALQFDEATVVDNKANLVWARDANIARKAMTYHDAVRFVDELNAKAHAGFRDWRLPTIEDLKGLMLLAKCQPAKSPFELLNSIGFSDVQRGSYWSSTNAPVTDSHDKEPVWVITTWDGGPASSEKDLRSYVWPVCSR
jgi:hypothetical protein